MLDFTISCEDGVKFPTGRKAVPGITAFYQGFGHVLAERDLGS